MALIEVTVDNPSLISTGGTGSRERSETDEGAGTASETGTDSTDESMETAGTLLTAATTVAGVLEQLRSENEEAAESADEGLFDNGEDASGDEEAAAFEESVVEGDVPDEATDVEDAGADETDESSGSGVGLLVAFVLVVALVVAALWMRGGDEGVESDDDWD